MKWLLYANLAFMFAQFLDAMMDAILWHKNPKYEKAEWGNWFGVYPADKWHLSKFPRRWGWILYGGLMAYGFLEGGLSWWWGLSYLGTELVAYGWWEFVYQKVFSKKANP